MGSVEPIIPPLTATWPLAFTFTDGPPSRVSPVVAVIETSPPVSFRLPVPASTVTPLLASIVTLPSLCRVTVLPVASRVNVCLPSPVASAIPSLRPSWSSRSIRCPRRDTSDRRLIAPEPPSTSSIGPGLGVSTPLNSPPTT